MRVFVVVDILSSFQAEALVGERGAESSAEQEQHQGSRPA